MSREKLQKVVMQKVFFLFFLGGGGKGGAEGVIEVYYGIMQVVNKQSFPYPLPPTPSKERTSGYSITIIIIRYHGSFQTQT